MASAESAESAKTRTDSSRRRLNPADGGRKQGDDQLCRRLSRQPGPYRGQGRRRPGDDRGRRIRRRPVSADVIVFADMDGSPATLDIAVVLVGKTLADIAPTDFA